MALDLIYAATLRDSMLDLIDVAIDAGAGVGLLRIYAGSVPADADASVAGNTLLAQCDMAATSGTVSSNVWTAGTIDPDTSADAGAPTDATFFRCVDSDANNVLQGTVGTASADLILNAVGITAGDNVEVTAMAITGGNT